MLLHDDAHGTPLIDALARHGDGLPANVLPLAVNEVTQVGLETHRRGVRLRRQRRCASCCAPSRATTSTGLHRTMALAEPILAGLGFGAGRVATIETDDPDALGEALARDRAAGTARRGRRAFLPTGGKRDVMRLALRELHRAAPAPVDVVPLPAGAPFGTVEVERRGLHALPRPASRPARPARSATIPSGRRCASPRTPACNAGCARRPARRRSSRSRRSSISAPRPRRARVLKQEEPFRCIRCGKPFGVKSTIERVIAKLEGKHWMFQGNGASALDVIKMCDDCRVAAMTEAGLRSLRRAAAPDAAHHRGLSARARGTRAGMREGRELTLPSYFCRRLLQKLASARRDPPPSRCVCSGILVPGV